MFGIKIGYLEKMEINKQNVLLSLLTLRNDDLKSLRDRIYRTSIFTVTLFMVFIGWIVESKTHYDLTKTLFLTIAVFGIWISNFITIWGLRNRFNDSRKSLIRIEQSLALYEKGIYHPDGQSLWPSNWQKEIKSGRIEKLILLVTITAAVTVIFTWINYALSI